MASLPITRFDLSFYHEELDIHPRNVFIAGGSTRAVAQSVARLQGQMTRDGQRSSWGKVYCADPFGDHDTAQIAEFIKLPQFSDDSHLYHSANRLDEKKICNSLALYTGAMEFRFEQIEYLEHHTQLLGNSSQTLQRLANKPDLFRGLEDAGLRVPQWCLPEELASWTGEMGYANVLGKKFHSFGGLQVKELGGSSDLSNPDFDWFQQKLMGKDLSAAFVRIATGTNTRLECLGFSRPLVGDKRFHSQGYKYTGSMTANHLSSDEDENQELIEKVMQLADYVGGEYDLIGLFNLDLHVVDGQVYFLEVNPRISASMELFERQGNCNLFALQWFACRGQGIDSKKSCCQPTARDEQWRKSSKIIAKQPTDLPVYGKAVWYADRPIRVGESFPDMACQQFNSAGFPRIADIPPARQMIEVDSPVFTVFAEGECEDEVAEKLLETARMFDSQIDS